MSILRTTAHQSQDAAAALARVIQECWEIAEHHGFHDIPGVGFGDRCALIHSEVSEAFEAWRAEGRHTVRTENGKPEGPAAELADVVIRCFDTALADCQMPAEQFAGLILAKMAYNRTRPYRHGKAL